jgi:hypothetical protein
MARILTTILLVLVIIFCHGCSGWGFEKRTTFVPNSVSFGYNQEKYKSDPHAWDGFSISATWVFK